MDLVLRMEEKGLIRSPGNPAWETVTELEGTCLFYWLILGIKWGGASKCPAHRENSDEVCVSLLQLGAQTILGLLASLPRLL